MSVTTPSNSYLSMASAIMHTTTYTMPWIEKKRCYEYGFSFGPILALLWDIFLLNVSFLRFFLWFFYFFPWFFIFFTFLILCFHNVTLDLKKPSVFIHNWLIKWKKRTKLNRIFKFTNVSKIYLIVHMKFSKFEDWMSIALYVIAQAVQSVLTSSRFNY